MNTSWASNMPGTSHKQFKWSSDSSDSNSSTLSTSKEIELSQVHVVGGGLVGGPLNWE